MPQTVRIHSFPLSGHAHRVVLFVNLAGINHEVINVDLAAGEIAFGPAAARLITVFNAPLDAEFAKATADKVLTKLENHLEGRDFLVGEKPTIADVSLYSYTAHAPEGNVSLEPYPNVRRWLANIEALPGFVPMPATKVGLAA
ncbi:MAG: glutathione S-transferase [Candidatus Competibacteraceae bacterium]|nr:glutathione S-transferase [Candidatus Competibacteraceae bacterium]